VLAFRFIDSSGVSAFQADLVRQSLTFIIYLYSKPFGFTSQAGSLTLHLKAIIFISEVNDRILFENTIHMILPQFFQIKIVA